jgi:predicted nucleic acid-binding protein
MTELEQSNKLCFIDSNIWLYAFIETPHKSLIAKSLLRDRDITISTQVINEVCVNLIKKARFPEEKIRNLIESFYNKYNVIKINREILLKASEIRRDHLFSFWDSLILAGALLEGCDILYSEDMQDDFVMEKTRIVNPFK